MHVDFYSCRPKQKFVVFCASFAVLNEKLLRCDNCFSFNYLIYYILRTRTTSELFFILLCFWCCAFDECRVEEKRKIISSFIRLEKCRLAPTEKPNLSSHMKLRDKSKWKERKINFSERDIIYSLKIAKSIFLFPLFWARRHAEIIMTNN